MIAVFIVPVFGGGEGLRLASVYKRLTGTDRLWKRRLTGWGTRLIYKVEVVNGRSLEELFEALALEKTRPPRLLCLL
jgi:hypothetical protein